MVDQVGPKPSTALQPRIAPVGRVANVAAVQPSVQDTVARADPSSLRALAQPLAASPPVNSERVATIRKAIAEGRFPLVPTTIADRLIALKLNWNPNEQA